MAMEYIQGQTLGALIAGDPPPSIIRRLELIEELCDGLHYAHRQGVVHRDVKPANLMVDAEGTLKILDFGIARAAAESGMTQAGLLVGTLNYMSPEQLDGGVVDARADVFAVGAVTYELLSYQRAFRGDVAGAVMRNVLSGTFEPLDALCPSLDTEVVAIVTRCLESDLAKRWSVLDAVRQKLAAIRRRLAEAVDNADTTIRPTASASVGPAPATPASRRDLDRQRLLQLRADQIAERVRQAREALGRADVPAVLELCHAARLLDPDDRDAIELEEQAHAALEQQQLDAWITEARADLERGALTAAAELADRALALKQPLPEAVAIKQAVQDARRRLAVERELANARDEAIAAAAAAAARAAAERAALPSPAREAEPQSPHPRRGHGRTLMWTTAAVVIAIASVVMVQQWGRVAEPTPVALNEGPVANELAGPSADESRRSALSTVAREGADAGTPPAPGKSLRSKAEPAKPQPGDTGSSAVSEKALAAVGGIQATQTACDRGDGGMCFELGVSYRTGRGAGVDHTRATGLFLRACDGGFARGCNAVGIAYARGLGVPRDDARAAALYQRGCDNGDGSACVNLGRMHEGAVGTPKDDSRATALFVRGCDGGDDLGCSDAGRMYQQGRGVAKDEARAVTLYQRACANGHAAGCAGFGGMYFRGAGVAKDEAHGVALFQQACDAGSPAACNNLGLAYFQGRGIAKDVKRAAEFYQLGCDKESPFACTNLGLMYLRGQDVPRDDVRAATLFRQACDKNHPGGCFNLGYVYATGRGVTKDESRAVVLYQRACDGAIGDACTRAASMYEQGLGVAADSGRAAALYQRGRDLVASRDATTGSGPQPLRVGGAIKAPDKLKDARPTYPVAAQYAGVQGVVVIEAIIGPGGNVERTKVLQSIPLLDGAAEEAVKRWQDAPTVVDGKPVPVVMTVNVNFSLQNGAPK